MTNLRRHLSASTFCIALIGALCLVGGSAQAEGFSAGVELREQAALSEMGLPAYPGATEQQDRNDDKPAVTLGLWGGSLGFKLQVRKYASSDGIGPVAAFYREALAQYGEVLDCSQPQPKRASKGKRGKDGELSCGDEVVKPGSRVYKVGTDKDFRMVAVQPRADGVHFQLLRIVTQGF